MSEIARFESPIDNFIGQANRCVVEDSASAEKATDLGKMIAAYEKKLEAHRDERTKPLLATKNKIFNDYKPLLARLKDAKATVKGQLLAHMKREREAQAALREQQRLAELEAAAKLEPKAQDEELGRLAEEEAHDDKPAETIRGDYGGRASMTARWSFEIVDATKIPRGYLKPDDSKIRNVILSGAREIPGLRIFQKEAVRF